MNVTDAQKQQIARWLDEGAKLSEIQSRLAEAGVSLTYMELKFLLSDLQLKPKDAAPPPEVADLKVPASGSPPAQPAPPAPNPASQPTPPPVGAPGAAVQLTVDQITKPGSIVSGKVTFTDGVSAEWFLDQMGRLGLTGPDKAYRPPAADVAEFQKQLQSELMKLGF
jgi:hypothetical protein